MTNRRIGLSAALGLAAALVVSQTVGAASTTWKLYSFNWSGRALSSNVAKLSGGSVVADLPSDTYIGAAYLLSAKTAAGTAGLSATIDVAGSPGTVLENYPDCTGSADPQAYLFFQGKSKGGFEPSDYWWYGPGRVALNPLLAAPAASMSAPFANRSGWTNYYGQHADSSASYTQGGVTYGSPSAGFDNALANMTEWGISLGGNCFFANGVAATQGSASIVLQP